MRLSLAALLMSAAPLAADDRPWQSLTLDDFRKPDERWYRAASVRMDPANPRRLKGQKASGGDILVNGDRGRVRDLYTKKSYKDVQFTLEFMIPKRSNSGVKFMGLYEIQILDTHGRDKLTGDSLGGVYPRAKYAPRYTRIDDGVPPKVNAAKPAGEWQTLAATFRAPRFKGDKKVQSARLVEATLNGKLIHKDVELKTPTGANWTRKERPEGPLMLQGNHGPVALRNVRVRALDLGS